MARRGGRRFVACCFCCCLPCFEKVNVNLGEAEAGYNQVIGGFIPSLPCPFPACKLMVGAQVL